MANTFKVKTKAGVGTSAGTVYTVPGSTTTIVLGLILGNVTGSAVNATVTVETNTNDTETNADVELVTNAPIPAGGSLELIDGGSKVVLQSGDSVEALSDTASAVDCILSVVDSIST